MVVLYSICILKKQVSKIKLLAISFELVGCYQLIGATEVAWSDLNWEGILAGLASALAFAFYTIYGEKGLARYSSWTVFFYALLFATIFWNIAHPPFVLVGQGWSWSIWLMIIAVAVLGTLLPFSLFLLALKRLDPIRVTVTSTLEPIFATITAYFFLNELLTVKQIIGACFILFSVILMALQKKESPPQGGELFHSQN
jgi:drug/metabolite transporter (DMT)-like permease